MRSVGHELADGEERMKNMKHIRYECQNYEKPFHTTSQHSDWEAFL
jgi:hypothetical protein